ncbi:SIS domain-containing protein [Mesorhizobium sp. CA18]|uniref:SIS domain-containing protein n=1 Tax=unclassified Mesorhizobium TaxID=325217 RepID=UPI001CCA9D92|nr:MULTISPECIES: SIS domain-containing protein [unclassified Mesorhizobium]MBZ9735750.1 SIS domain-containing protein [Mesorhizobium sp. CA9]MBZ9827649.1 SIS domain-containing protein [Mesorhizobium sp. CA18]MBZ9833351.1 SIS domain-containing protein [Mesorhizobium sp. CA2]MBZ9839638.1 SIS domain-containing protein [Mesorhizobium sp. CA3]MBZ9879841.1 SIS domain-containing protein [Mesorhizobium sp. Ca11]
MSYRSTIARQPEALADTYAAVRDELAEIDMSSLDRTVIGVTGIGASYAAAVVVAAELQTRNRRAFAIRSVDMAKGNDLCDALIGLSHRGRSVETVAALEKLLGARRLAITNNPESPLARAANLHLRLANGSDATPSSTGYTATLLAAGMAVQKLMGVRDEAFAEIPSLVGQLLSAAAAKMDRLGKLLSARRAIDCVGAGASLGTADEASLLIREASRIPASAYDTRHYLHGPMESMDETTAVVLFGGGREVELAQYLESIGCPALLVTTAEGIDDGRLLTVIKVPRCDNLIAQAIVDIIIAQLLAATLSDAAGLTDTKFRYRMSDTKVPEAA